MEPLTRLAEPEVKYEEGLEVERSVDCPREPEPLYLDRPRCGDEPPEPLPECGTLGLFRRPELGPPELDRDLDCSSRGAR